MKVFFKEIRSGDLESVRIRLDADAELVRAVAKAPPKKDDGQSPLQVAIKSSNFDIAHLLIDRGADVDFIEDSRLNRWNIPVLHDAIRASVFSARWGSNRALPGETPKIEMMNTWEQFDQAAGVLTRLLELGADVAALDSAGNPALLRAVLDAKQIVREPLRAELVEDLHRVFGVLLAAGADPRWVDPRFDMPIVEYIEGHPVRQFLP